MADVDVAIMEAWWRVKPLLLADPEELARRLARRRMPLLLRPPRAFCLAVRASDRRMTAWETAMVPEKGAMGWKDEDGIVRYGEHVVTIDKKLLVKLCSAVELRVMDSGREAAKRLGVSLDMLRSVVRRKLYRVERAWGRVNGIRCQEALIWRNEDCDPCSGNAFRPADAAWGGGWRYLAENLKEGMEWEVKRVPEYKGYRDGSERFRGWRWICPACGKRARTVFLPRKVPTVAEFLGDEKRVVKSEADELPMAAETFACGKCHGVRYWSSLTNSAWNHLVAYLSGGLLYGREVERPAWVVKKRKRKYSKHKSNPVRGEEVARLLTEGKKYAEIASEMGIGLGTVQRHVRAVYARYGVGSRKELGEVRSQNETPRP